MRTAHRVIKTFVVVASFVLGVRASEAQPSLAPDFYLPEISYGNYPFTDSRDQCAVVSDPRLPASGVPFENFVVLEGFNTYAGISSYFYLSSDRRMTYVTTNGVQQSVDRYTTEGRSRNVIMSRDGRNIAMMGYTPAYSGLSLHFSSDYGATFVDYPLPVNPGFNIVYPSDVGVWSNGTFAHGNLAFDQNGNLFVFYISRMINPSSSVSLHTAELYLGVLDPNGAVLVPPFVVSELSASFPYQVDARMSTLAVGNHIVFASNWGKAYSDGSTNPPVPNVPMMVVIDTVAGTISKISFGGSVSPQWLAAPKFLINHALSSLYSDGESIYLLTNSFSSVTQGRSATVRRFSPQSANYAHFFINTAPAGADPFMDFDDPQLQFGTDLSQIVAASGITPLQNMLIESFNVRQKGGGFQGDEIVFVASKINSNPTTSNFYNRRFKVSNINGTPKVVTVDDVVDIPDSVIRGALFEPGYPRGLSGSTQIRPQLPQVMIQASGQNVITSFCMRLRPQPGSPFYTNPYTVWFDLFGADVQ